jgi:hypothetical protein
MVVERLLYAYPSWRAKLSSWPQKYFAQVYVVLTWTIILSIYSLYSPFDKRDLKSPIDRLLVKYCSYNYRRLLMIATVRSVIYFCLFVPALFLTGFVLRYFFLMRGTNQIPGIQKLWTIRVIALLCGLVFYDVYLFYLENIAETFKSFLTAAVLHSTFYLMQSIIIVCTEPYWLELFVGRYSCLCCWIARPRREHTTPVAISSETEFSNMSFSSATGNYALVDDTIDDEFDRATLGTQPTLRIIV